MADLSTRDAKLVQYLNEAYGKERELETALEAHIGMTTRTPYRKRLQQHLSETKRHATAVQRRIKQLGGEAETVPVPGPDALSKGAEVAVELGSRAVAAAKGPLHMIRGTGEQEKMLKNAKTEYSEEHEEIATYTAIEELARSVGDTATAQLARAIRREEERMASFLARLIPSLTKAVVQDEVPAAERRAASSSRTKRAGAKRSGAAKRGAAAKRTGTAKRTSARRTTATKRTGTKRAAGAAKRATKGAASKASRKSPVKRGTAAKPASRATSAAKRAGAKSRKGVSGGAKR